MPQLPSQALDFYQSHTSAVEPMRRITPSQSPSPVGAAIENFAEGAQVAANAQGAAYAARSIAQAQDTWTQEMQQRKANAQPGAPGFTGQVLSDYDKYANDLVSKAPKGPAQHFLNERLLAYRDQISHQANAFEIVQRTKNNVDSVTQLLDSSSKIVSQDPTQFAPKLAEQRALIGQMVLEPDQKEALLRNSQNTLAVNAAYGMIDQDPMAAKTELMNNDTKNVAIMALTSDQRDKLVAAADTQIAKNQGQSIVNTFANQGPDAGAKAMAGIDKLPVSDDIKQRIIQSAQSGLGLLQDQRRQQYSQQLIGLESRLAAGKPAPDDKQVAQMLYQKSAIGQEQYAANLASIDRANQKQADQNLALEKTLAAYQSHTPLDPKTDKGDVNDLFLSMTQKATPGTPEWNNIGVDIAAKTGVIPQATVDYSRANLVSGKPQQAVDAAMTISRLRDASPRGASFGIDQPTNALATQISSMVKAGTDQQTAVDIARKNQDISTTQHKLLDDRWKQLKPEVSARSVLPSLLNNDNHFRAGFFTGTPNVPPAMMGEFNNLTRDYFNYTGGDLKQAQQLAVNDLKSIWGVTEVNGKRELMKYAPESMVPGLTAAMIRDDIDASMPNSKGAILAPLPGPGGTEDTHGLRWTLMAPNKFGMMDTLKTPQGNDVTYALPGVRGAYDKQHAKQLEETAQRAQLQHEIHQSLNSPQYKEAMANIDAMGDM